MKNKIQKSTLIAGALILSSMTFAQKKNETSAAVEFKNKYQPALMSGDMAGAQKALTAGKEFIDLAADHPETKESSKTHYYRGEIYLGHLIAFATDTVFMKANGENYLNIGIESFKKSLSLNSKFKSDIEQSILEKKAMFGMAINMLYDQGKFQESAEAYELQVRLSEGMNEIDTTSMYNAGICYEQAGDNANAAKMFVQCAKIGYKAPEIYARASANLRKAGKSEEAKAMLVEARKKYTLEKSILLELVNISIDGGDAAGAEAALADAIKTDPNNKQLYYTIGTIYIDLKQNEKAEESLNKALEIDPEYTDALYQLGAHLVGWASDITAAANQLKFGDPKYDKMIKDADAIFNRAISPLERYIAKNPNDKDVLNILVQLYRNLGNQAKAAEYKKRVDALK